MAPATSHKRKIPLGGLQRRVRARREDIEPEIEEYSEEEGNVDGESDDVSDRERQMSDESDSASGSDDDNEEKEDEDEEDPSSAVTQVSFGALAKAQASMPSIRRKKGRKVTNSEDEDEDEEEEVGEKADERWPSKSDSKSSNPPKKLPQRSSKHAPTEMSSKRMVSRKREVVSVNKVAPRDPRFSAASGAVDEARARKAYAFLDEYRDAEMAQLRAAIKKTKSADEKEALARALKSMQSRKEAQAKKDAERELVAQHRRQEKELVAQGKKPFYLKKSEQKKQLLLERFAGMKKKQVDRTIERRRKKLTARERRNMPVARRDAT